MYPLTRFYARKLYRQKLIYIFFACFFTASFFYAFLISTPQMEEMLNINIGIVGRKNFPEFMMRFYVGTVGILFHVFLLTLFICEEDRNKMLYQPLLHGENRSRMIRSKIYVAVSMSTIFVLLVAFINYITAFMRWGYEIFEQAAFIRTMIIYLLIDQFIYNSNITLLQKIWVGYYLNLWTFAYEYQKIPFGELLIGISVMILYGIAFFQISLYRTQKIDF